MSLESRKAMMLSFAGEDAANGTFFSFSDDINVDELLEIMEIMNVQEKERFFEKLLIVVSTAITNICVMNEDDDDDCLVPMSVDNEQHITDIISNLKKVVTMLVKMSTNSHGNDPNVVQIV